MIHLSQGAKQGISDFIALVTVKLAVVTWLADLHDIFSLIAVLLGVIYLAFRIIGQKKKNINEDLDIRLKRFEVNERERKRRNDEWEGKRKQHQKDNGI